MKRLFLVTALLIAACISFAAIDEYYTFNATTGTYAAISGTNAGISSDDVLSAAIPLGFSFPYGEAEITQIKISSNGWIDLGGTQPNSYLGNDLASTTIRPVIAPLWDDTSLASGTAQYLLTGTAPNRVFTVQYANLKWNYNSSTLFNFQVRIYETGKIDMVYGSSTGAPNLPSASIGINMAPGGSGWFYSVTPGPPATVSTTADNNLISAFPAQGTIYEFNPVVAVPNDLAALSVSGNPTPSVGIASNYTITVRNRGSNPQTTYQVKLFHGAEAEIGSVDGTEIQPNQILTFVIPWTPAVAGPDILYGKVILGGDQNPANDQTPNLDVIVFPAGVEAVTIGDGSLNQRVPLDFYWKNSLFECLYYQDELGFISGTITALQFYNNFSTNLPNGATKLWLGSTNLPDLSGGWIPSTQLTLVYDGTVQYPSGANTITIPLQTPYMHTPGNLVLMANRPMDTQYYSSADYFQAQTIGTNRSWNIYSDNFLFDPAAPPTGANLSGLFPKTTIIYSPFGTGALQGTVFGVGNQPLADATVTVTGALQNYTTGADGTYIFPHLLPGTVEVTVTRHGYLTLAQEAVIAEGQTTTLDFYLQPMPVVALSGRVVGSDAPLSGLAGAEVAFTGYEDYSATTGDGGYFTLPSVYASQTYSYTASKTGYTTVSGPVEVGETDLDMGDILLTEVAFPPVNVTAAEANDFNSVLVAWSEPGTFAGEWLHYDSGVNFDSIGSGAADFSVAVRYPASALTNYAGTSLQAINYWPGAPGSYWLRVWTGGSPTAPGTLVVDQAVTPVINTYNSVLLDSPVLITGTEELWFGYRVSVTSGYPAGCDAGPATDGFGNMIFWNNTWTTLYTLAPSLNYNWNIQGFVGFFPPTRLTQNIFTATSESRRDRVLQGYQVWRLLSGDEANEAAWAPLTPTPVNETSFTDLDWAPLPSNIYKYAVKAVYSNSVFSHPAFSNAIEKGMMGVLSGTVTDFGTGALIEGAVISAGIYSGTSDDQGHYEFQVYQGTYTVACARAGYQPWSLDNILIQGTQNTTLDIVLSEMTYPAYGVTAAQALDLASVELNWHSPGSASPNGTGDLARCADRNDRLLLGYLVSRLLAGSENDEAAWELLTAAAIPDTHYTDSGWDSLPPGIYRWAVKCVYTGGLLSVPAFSNVIEKGMMGVLSGTVTDFGTGALIEGAVISAGIYSGSSNALGFYEFPIHQGSYTVTCSRAGYQPWSQDNVWIQGTQTTTLDIALSELTSPPIGVTATQSTDHTTALITWQDPYSASPAGTGGLARCADKGDRLLLGYLVSRLHSGSENDEASWVLLTAAAIPDTQFTDSSWGTLSPGNYRWAVKCVYTGGLFSVPAFSNVLPRGVHRDLAALSLSGDLTPVIGVPSVYTLLVGNVGNVNVTGTAYTVKLLNGTIELASQPGVALTHGSSHEFAFDWTPADPGPLTLTGKVVYPTDAVPANNTTDLDIIVQEPNVPVELSSFTAIQTAENTVRLAWVTQSETAMLGYRVYRANTSVQSSAVLVSGELIPATNTSAAQTYVFTDAEVEAGQTWYYWLESVEFNQSAYHGPVSVTLTGEAPPLLPELSALRGAYPNPFRFGSATRIGADVKAGETGTLAIYNVSGQLVRTFSVNEGSHSLLWDGRDASGRACGSGIYFCRLSTPSLNQTRKLMLIK